MPSLSASPAPSTVSKIPSLSSSKSSESLISSLSESKKTVKSAALVNKSTSHLKAGDFVSALYLYPFMLNGTLVIVRVAFVQLPYKGPGLVNDLRGYFLSAV